MQKLILFIALNVFQQSCFAIIANYTGFAFGGVSANSQDYLYANSPGLNFNGVLGMRFNTVGIEGFLKLYQFQEERFQNDEGQVVISGTTYVLGAGTKMFISQFFNLRAGVVWHDSTTKISINEQTRNDRGLNNKNWGLYAGLGPNFQLSKDLDCFADASFTTLPSPGVLYSELELGLRLYF